MSAVQDAGLAGDRWVWTDRLPQARGPISGDLLEVLRRDPGSPVPMPRPCGDPLADDDMHLALYLAYELHYRGLPGVSERWEWDPGLLAMRAVLERRFEDGLRELVPEPDVAPGEVPESLHELVAQDTGPSLSRYVRTEATLEQVRELLVHRSAYQLKEADPHSWAIPRLSGAAKVALVEVQADEYGSGDPRRMHATLFAGSMAALGLDPTYGRYVELLPGATLATVNLMSMLGLHRRLRGAIVGHLAAFELTSSLPNRRYGDGLRRLGLGSDVTGFFDEHVEADAVHENIATWDLAGGLVRTEPALAGDVLWGAAVLLALEAAWAGQLLEAWAEDRSSLLAPLA